MRLYVVFPKNLGDGPANKVHFATDDPRRPSRSTSRGRRQSQLQDPMLHFGRHGVVLSAGFGLVSQPVDAALQGTRAFTSTKRRQAPLGSTGSRFFSASSRSSRSPLRTFKTRRRFGATSRLTSPAGTKIRRPSFGRNPRRPSSKATGKWLSASHMRCTSDRAARTPAGNR